MMKKFDPRLYLILERAYLRGKDLPGRVAELLEHGVTLVQLRDKTLSDSEMVSFGRELKSVLNFFGIPLIINDRIQVAAEVGAAGVHLGQSDANPHIARRVLGKDAIIGLSCETLSQAAAAEKCFVVDYISASPVFVSVTKFDIAQPWGVEGVRCLRKSIRLPIVAIGGISPRNVGAVLDAGADGIALASALLTVPLQQVSAMREQIDRWFIK